MSAAIALRAAIIAALCPAAGFAVAADWPQFGYDAAHSGDNAAENSINASNVAQLLPLYAGTVTLPTKVDSAPVYANNVSTSSGVKDLLFAFGSNALYDGGSSMGTLLAIDAATGGVVWSKSTSGSSQHASSSPAIDPARQYVYCFGLDGAVHKYQIGNGTEVTTPGPAGWPAPVTLKANAEKVAGGLTIASSGGTNYLEVVTNGYNGDGGDYQGHLLSINLASGARTVFNTMCSNLGVLLANGGCAAVQGGVWGLGGATFDAATNRLYITTGNGLFDANSAGHYNWGDSVLALGVDGSGTGGGMPRDSYTPSNYQQLYDDDTDLGSMSLALLPAPANSSVRHLGLQGGKDAKLRLLDLTDLASSGVIFADSFDGTHRAALVGGELQILDVTQGGSGMREQPAVWTNGADGSSWIFVANWAGLSAVQLGLDGSHRPLLTQRWSITDASTSPIVANGVLYNAGACSNGNGNCVIARNPLTGSVLWSAPIGGLHWQSPIVVNGALYLIDSSARLWKFGLN
jgi:hypothetical protein